MQVDVHTLIMLTATLLPAVLISYYIFIILCYCFRYSSDDPDILEWDEKSWRDSDWVEQAKCRQALGWDDSGDPAEFIYLENPDLQQYRWVGA